MDASAVDNILKFNATRGIGSLQREILEGIRQGCCTSVELASFVDRDTRDVSSKLAKMLRKGLIEKRGIKYFPRDSIPYRTRSVIIYKIPKEKQCTG